MDSVKVEIDYSKLEVLAQAEEPVSYCSVCMAAVAGGLPYARNFALMDFKVVFNREARNLSVMRDPALVIECPEGAKICFQVLYSPAEVVLAA